MTKKEFNKLTLKWESMTDTLRWKFLIGGTDFKYTLILDDVYSYIQLPGIEEVLDFETPIGKSEGLAELFKALKIKYKFI